MTPHETIQDFLRHNLTKKHRELQLNLADFVGHPIPDVRKKAKQAAYRNEKSIALLVSKTLCEHEVQVRFIRNSIGKQIETFRCDKCRTTCPGRSG